MAIFRRNNKDYYTLHVNKEENKMDEHPELTEWSGSNEEKEGKMEL